MVLLFDRYSLNKSDTSNSGAKSAEKAMKDIELKTGYLGGQIGSVKQSTQLETSSTRRQEKPFFPSLKLPSVPFTIHEKGGQVNSKARPLQKDTFSLPQPIGKDMVMKELYNTEIEPSKIQHGVDSTQCLPDENEHTDRRRASVCSSNPSVAGDDFSSLLYNEAYCMKNMNFTRNHTFSFFHLHPVYKERNTLFRNGADSIRITRYRPKVAKPFRVVPVDQPPPS